MTTSKLLNCFDYHMFIIQVIYFNVNLNFLQMLKTDKKIIKISKEFNWKDYSEIITVDFF